MQASFVLIVTSPIVARLVRSNEYLENNLAELFCNPNFVIFFSESKLNKVFKLYVGIGPGTYYRRLRIQKAMELYRDGSTSWTEVSHIVGYADLPSFSKAFKKITGTTPNSFSL